MISLLSHLLYNVGVFEVLKQGDFSDGRRGNAIILALQTNFLDGHHLASQCVDSFVNNAIGSLAQALTLLVLLKSLDHLGRGTGLVLSVDHIGADISVNVVPHSLRWLSLHYLIIIST